MPYVLCLNPMMSRFEHLDCVAKADTAEALEQFLEREKVEPYVDEGPESYGGVTKYRKSFRKGGPLEWYNSPDSRPHIVEVDTREVYMEKAGMEYDRTWNSIPSI